MENTSIEVLKLKLERTKNKQLRSELSRQLKLLQTKTKIQEKKKRRKDNEALGDDAPPKKVPRTLESMRVRDDTMVDAEDEEVQQDEAQDEMASFFAKARCPKVLITTTEKPHGRTIKFCSEFHHVVPNSTVYYRRSLDLKKIIPQAIKREYTDIIVVNEDNKQPNGLLICHLPDGPTAHFKLSSLRLCSEIKNCGGVTKHHPEVILNNFNTRLGHSVGRLLASVFPYDPEFQGRRCVTFHNQRDFIFFRHHRYQFRNEKRVGLHELGPKFTLKLRSLQKGTFDSKFGEYEWVYKRHEMETSRRKFFL